MSLHVAEIFGAVRFVSGTPHRLRRFGVPPGGAFDYESMVLANALLGLSTEASCLELSMASLKFRADANVALAWVGASALNSVIQLRAGDEFVIEFPATGCRGYVAGLVDPEDQQLKAGMTIGGMFFGSTGARLSTKPSSVEQGSIPVVTGPHASLVDFRAFLAENHQVSPVMDRVGIRLVPVAGLEHEVHLQSGPSQIGAIQITPGGQPILVGPDGPTIGGYPIVAVIPRFALGYVAQLRPGERVRFHEISLDEAQAGTSNWLKRLEKQAGLLRAVSSVHT